MHTKYLKKKNRKKKRHKKTLLLVPVMLFIFSEISL